MDKGSLRNAFQYTKRPFAWKWNSETPIRYKIAYDIAAGLACLHENNLVHRDVKAPNVLITIRDGKFVDAKLADWIGNSNDFGRP